MRTKMFRYGFGFSVGHFVVIAILVPLEVIFREYPIGILAWRVHRIVDLPVWGAPRLITGFLASKTLTEAMLAIFPGPSASPALITLELAIFGVTGGVLYFILGIIVSWLLTNKNGTTEQGHSSELPK